MKRSPQPPRRARLSASALFLPPLLFAFACQLDANIGFDNTCVDDSDCPAGQICGPNGACVDPACVPAPEVCDGIDNDCNGAVDEVCGQPCDPNDPASCPPGQVCAPDGTCVGGVPELCDGIDNNGNGQVDEGCGQPCDPSDPANSCPPGQVCDPATGTCVGGCVPGPEACDGIDNDCNGIVDDGCGQICSNGQVCPPGHICAPDGTCVPALPCDPADPGSCPPSHVCDPDLGVCVPVCVPAPEECDGIDNDCNGQIDEVCWQPCDPNGGCPPGQVCGPDGLCHPGCVPAPEVCDGIDNDCNGQVDEACGQPCDPNDPANNCPPGQVCDPATGTCTANCVPGSVEICDGVDNNCNGAVDEGCGQPCDPNGSCPPGQMCGPDGLCHPGCLPSPEVCDGIDNDCNGQTDEGCNQPCDPNDPANNCPPGQMCGPDGLCHPVCVPSPEICDGTDNDCDGTADEGCVICASDADCPPGHLCDLAIGACVPACAPGDPNCP